MNLNVGYVDDRAFKDRPTCEEGARWASRIDTLQRIEGFGSVVVVSNHMEQFSVEFIKCAQQRTAQPHSTLDDGVENRLEVCRRTTDDIEHFARSCLMMKSFGECVSAFCYLACARLFGLEQPRVLNGDDGLVGKGLQQRNLVVAEGLDFRAADGNHAKRCTRMDQWDGQ